MVKLQNLNEPKWGSLGKMVYERTYARIKPNGEKENWAETVTRVVNGNCSLVPSYNIEPNEQQELFNLIYNFKMIPGGRHLWSSGVPGRQFLFNCVSAGWDPNDFTYHFDFLFEQLMQGSGVGTNYSNRYISPQAKPKNVVQLHFVCDDNHPDFLENQSLFSSEYSSNWTGSITIEDSREGWSSALKELLTRIVYTNNSPLVFDVSSIRAKGMRIKGFGGISSGPRALILMLQGVHQFLMSKLNSNLSSVDFMMIDHLIAQCVIAGNVRRSARIAVKSWQDWDVTEFIECKKNTGEHWTSNISVEVDDEFFLAWKKKEHHARRVFDNVIDNMMANGEPGFWNISRNQDGEPEPDKVFSPNPCGEITLQEFENCNIGSVNLGADWISQDEFDNAFRLMSRFLIRATYGNITDSRQKEVVSRNRRIGVGIFGYQTWLVKQNIKFSESFHSSSVKKSLRRFYDIVRSASDDYAFRLRIPSPVKCTTVAPTGTTAMLCGETTGIQPIYTRYGVRRVRYASNDAQLLGFTDKIIEDDIYSPNTKVVCLPYKDALTELAETIYGDASVVEQQDEIHLADMLEVQAMIQDCYADNAISFTANIKEDTVTTKQMKAIMIQMLPKLKGTTIMIDASRPQMPFTRITKEEFEATNGEIGQGEMECVNGCPIR